MGCVASREDDKQLVPATPKQDEKVKFPAEQTSKPFIMNSIKRKDLILFEKTLKQNNTISLLKAEPIIQQKTLLHFIAEKDFHEGMALAIEYILQEHPDDAPQILNAKDTEGNTPLITCCYNNAWDTVKVLLKHGDLVNRLATNMSGKTAYDVALDLESPHAGLLSTRLSTGGSSSTQIDSANISTQPNQGSHHRSGSLLKVMSLKDVDLTSSLNSVDTPNALKSFKALSKDKAKSKFATRLTSLNEELKETGATSFIDNEFPHDILSLNAGLDDDTLEELYDLTWVKATDLLSSYSKIKVFGDIAVNDVSKSLLAGCDLYFALASMTEFPQRLFNVFTSNQVSNKGSYSVNFLVSGIPVEILLDDYFPCVEGSELVFSKPVKNELWFSLLEKAFAKLYGSYAHIKNVSLVEALETMTGMPSTQYQLNNINADKLWRDMLTFDHNNYIVCAGRNNDSVELNRILTVCRLTEVENMKIIKLMNHYGELRFRTSLVNNNDKWTAKVKEEVGYSIKETNCIYLELEEFLKIFDTLTVCAYNDNWTRSGLEVESEPSKPKFLKFEVEQDMDVILTVHQKLPVFLDEESDYNLSPIEVILAEQTDRGQIRGIAYGEKDALSGKQTVFASDNISVKLTKGTYVIRVKAHWVDGMSHDFSVNVFAPMPVVITETEKHNYPNFLNNLYISVGSNLERRFHLQHNCEFASAWAGSHLWVYGQNEGEKTWKLDIVIDKMTNLRRRKMDEKEENVIRLVVPPGEKVATYMKRVNCGAVELIWKFEQSWE